MKHFLLLLASAAALWSAACSNGGSNVQPPPPPPGPFGLNSLNGTYAFVTNGEVFDGASVFPFARVGSFTANGSGGITGGVEDVNSAGAASLAIPITGGSYTVTGDGRGTLTLNLNSGGVASSINFGIVLTSTSDGLMIDETSSSTQASTGSGNFVLQTGGPFTVASASGPYVFDFSGLDGTGAPDSIVGEFNASGGVISAGVQDENDNGNIPATPTPVSFTGVLAADPLDPNGAADLSTFGRGIATLDGINYVFYLVGGNRIRFLSTSGGEMLAGDAVAQSNTIPANVAALNSSFVFIVSGASGNGGVTRIGRFTANGASVTNVILDTNNAGAFHLTGGSGGAGAVTAASIALDAVNPGRGVVTFKDPTLQVPFTFVFYLSSATSGVIQDVSQGNQGATDVADGSLAAQTSGPFSGSNISGTYALNWSGLSLQNGAEDEEDFVAQAKISSLSLTGAGDIFQFQNGISSDLGVTGLIVPGGDGTGGDGNRNTMSVKLSGGGTSTVNFVVYVANPGLAFFANNQGTTRVVAGILKLQQ
jgi:hypothetical protein